MKSKDNGVVEKVFEKTFKGAIKIILPTDEEVSLWWSDNDIDNCSASSAIYLFRLWLKQRAIS